MQDDNFPTNAEYYHYDDSRYAFPVIVDRFKRSLERYTNLTISRDQELFMLANQLMEMERFLNRHVKRTGRIEELPYISVATANKILANYKDLVEMFEIRNKMLGRYDGKEPFSSGTIEFFRNKLGAVMARDTAMFRDVLINRFGHVIEAM